MNWTKKSPTDTGWYWFTANAGQIQCAVEVTLSRGQLVCDVPAANFHGKPADLEKHLRTYNAMRRKCDLAEVTDPEWSDERLPIPKIHL